MPKIHVLDEHLTNMIAAGEVVERPANIVKECVENSLDAGAGAIDVECFEGGIERLIITDDGVGMDSEDAWLAFQRHATSKLQNEEDLFAISTMGFRGEALASIAAVAKVDMVTSRDGKGTHIAFEYGKKILHEASSAPAGTRIEVRGLFLKTPARFKYLRKPQYEFSVIADLINKMAVSHPDVRFRLFHNGKLTFQSSGSGSLQEVIYAMYGADVARNAVEFHADNEDFSISGYAVQPKISRASKYFVFLSVNHRLIRSTQILNTVIDSYREYLPENRYPIVMMDIETDPQLVDVNVHPNKWEVRITKSAQLMQLILETIPELFAEKLETPSVRRQRVQSFEQPKLEERKVEYPVPSAPAPRIQEQPEPSVSRPAQPVWKEPVPAADSLPETPLQGRPDFRDYRDGNAQRSRTFNEDHRIEKVQEEYGQKVTFRPEPEISYPVPIPRPENTGHEFFDHLSVIGQLKESYILCENDAGLVIIDQHAAQERYHFEQLQKQFASGKKNTIPLMIPIVLKVPAGLLPDLTVLNQATEWSGIVFEEFGESELIVREVPVWLQDLEEQEFLQDILDYIVQGKPVDIEHMQRHMLATAACHSSIRFHRGLTREEMVQVIEDLKKCRQPYHCPHGRPTVITFSDADLRKEFERG